MMPEHGSLVLHGLSKHAIERTDGYNEINDGAGIRLDYANDVAVQAGFYNNSYSNVSKYVDVDWSPLRLDNLDGCGNVTAGLFAAVVDGYKNHTMAPAVGAQAAVECDRVFIRSRAWPSPGAGAVVSLEIGVKLN